MRYFWMLFLCLFAGFLQADSLQIVIPDRDGKVVFPPGETYRYPASFLQRYIRKSTGIKAIIVKESERKKGVRAIYVGATRFAARKIGSFQKMKPEELALIPTGKDLIICGEVTPEGIDRGTLFGVYEFLERQLGIRWFYPFYKDWRAYGSGEVVPKREKVTFPAAAVRSAPHFRQREGGVMYQKYYGIEIEKLWHPVLRFGNTRPHPNANHTQVNWVDLYGKTHPEYFAKSKSGEPRINFRHKGRTYICLSSQAVLDQMMKNLADLDAHKDPGPAWGPMKPDAKTVYFCCNDGMLPDTTCHCPDCAALLRTDRVYEEQGSELYYRFISRYAERIHEKYPQRRLAVLAYNHYLAPPEKSPVPDFLDVTYVGPKIIYTSDPAMYRQHQNYLKRWAELLGNDPIRLNIWLNIVNPTQYISAVPFMYPNLFKRFLLDNQDRISGVFINGFSPYLKRTGEVRIYGTIMSLPMVWIQSRLMWDPHTDPDRLLRDWCAKSYGPAADAMHDFYRLIIDRWENFYQTNQTMTQLDYIHRIRYPVEQVNELKCRLDAALGKAVTDPDAERRIKYLKNYVYSKFFRESEEYQKSTGRLNTYECFPAAALPEIDGKADDPAWRDAAELKLVKFQRGEPSPRKTAVKLVHKNGRIAFLARFEDSVPKDEFRIQIATGANPLSGKYAANINHAWPGIAELRIPREGKPYRYGAFPKYRVRTAQDGKAWLAEGEIESENLLSGGIPALRMQFIRYADVWNDYDLWCPTRAGISDYPTWRFGLVQLLPGTETVRTGLE